MAAATEVGIEARPGVPEPVGVGEEHLAGQDTCVRARRRGGRERLDDPGLDGRVVVDEQDPVGAAVERTPNAGVVAAREAEVDAGTDELDVRKALGDRVRRAVHRAVVDHDGLDPAKGIERVERVVAAVPRDDDSDDVHQGRRVKCAIEPASGRRSKRASPCSISPTSRAIPG